MGFLHSMNLCTLKNFHSTTKKVWENWNYKSYLNRDTVDKCT